MTELRREDPPAIDLYLDGLLDAPARAGFERRMQQDAALHDAVACQHRIDASLRRVCAAPSPEAVLRTLSLRAAASGRQTTSPARRALAIAASIAMIATGLWLMRDNLFPSGPASVTHARPTPAGVYRAELAAGFKPYWTCNNDQQFADTFRTRLGQPLLVNAPAGATTWGLAYTISISPETVVLLAEFDHTRRIVMIDRLRNDRAWFTSALDGSLHVFRRVIDSLVLYEVTPDGQSLLIDRFRNPAAASAPASAPQSRNSDTP